MRKIVSIGAAAAGLAVISVSSLPTALPLASAASGAAAHHQQRQLAVTRLSNFKVVLTATREPGLLATVTAAGYRHTPRGWKLIATKRIGKASGWSWFATEVCSLRTTQLKPLPSSAKPADSIRVSLLWGPAIGCLGPYTRQWQP